MRRERVRGHHPEPVRSGPGARGGGEGVGEGHALASSYDECRSQRLSARSGHTSAEWLERLPRLAAECAAEWDLELEEPFDTPRSLVVPAGGAVLKLNAPSHFEADHEADALACWDGRGAVRLLARDDERRALLLERCVPGRPPRRGRRRRGLDHGRAPGATARRRADRSSVPAPRGRGRRAGWRRCRERWEGGGRPFERSLLDAAIDVFGSVDRGATRLVNQDLHAWNVLRAEREPWLVIDPKPLVGEREVDGVGPLRNAGFAGDAAARAPLARRACRPRDGPRAASRLGPCPRSRVGLRPRPVVGAVDRGSADDQPRLTACSV